MIYLLDSKKKIKTGERVISALCMHLQIEEKRCLEKINQGCRGTR